MSGIFRIFGGFLLNFNWDVDNFFIILRIIKRVLFRIKKKLYWDVKNL